MPASHRSDPRYDPRHLPAFLAVCEAGGVRAAAPLLHKTQPAVTYQLRQLEQQLGAPLFERIGRRLVLTPSGRALRDFAQGALGDFAELADRIARREPERRAPVRVASVSGFGRYVLFPALTALLATPDFRHLQLHLSLPTAEEVFARVEQGSCDLGAAYLPRVSARLEIERVYRYEYWAVGPRSAASWLPTAARLRRLDAWGAMPFVTYDECDYVFGKWFADVFGRPPRALDSRHHVEELEETLDLVEVGAGVTIVPSIAVTPARRARLRVLRPGRRRSYNDAYLVTRPSAVRPEVAALVGALRTALR